MLPKGKMEPEPTPIPGAEVDPVSEEKHVHLTHQRQSLARTSALLSEMDIPAWTKKSPNVLVYPTLVPDDHHHPPSHG